MQKRNTKAPEFEKKPVVRGDVEEVDWGRRISIYLEPSRNPHLSSRSSR